MGRAKQRRASNRSRTTSIEFPTSEPDGVSQKGHTSKSQPAVEANEPSPVFRTLLSTGDQSTSAFAVEDEAKSTKDVKPFQFLHLPSELRTKIYGFVFRSTPTVIDLDPDNYKKIHRSLAIFYASRQVHNEASHHFFSTHTVRLFPTYPGRFFKSKKPLLTRISDRYRSSITSFELRLGPGFTNPPRGWVVNDALGLKDATSVRVLKIMVEVDTSDPVFKGFRRDDNGFYELFSRNLLDQVLANVPSIIEVQFDAYPSVRKNGDMMSGLLLMARQHGKLISWGPERGWSDRTGDGDEPQQKSVLARPSVNALSLALQAVSITA